MAIYTPEDEKFILEQGLKSEFWQLVTSKWSVFRETAMKSMLSPNYGNRDFLAGKIKGMDDLLNYPQKHIETLESKLDKQKEN